MRPRRGPEWRRNSAHRAGDSVSALNAEISIATMIVTANCRNSVPEIPAMKATGTNTESSTSVMRDDRRRDLASSPSWRPPPETVPAPPPSRARRFRPRRSRRRRRCRWRAPSPAARPYWPNSRTPSAPRTRRSGSPGTAMIGMMVARSCPRNTNTTSATRTNASKSVLSTSWMVSLTKVVESYDARAFKPSGKRALHLVQRRLHRGGGLDGVGAGRRDKARSPRPACR